MGLRTSSTIMFGHLDSTASWARHIAALRDLQARTGGITEFVPLPFVHMEAPVYLKGDASTKYLIGRVCCAACCAYEGLRGLLKGVSTEETINTVCAAAPGAPGSCPPR